MDAIDLGVDDFNLFLHALRTQGLQQLPKADVVVHGGCAGEWYFAWFRENYPGTPSRQYGIELFSPPPANLPEEVVWLAQSLGDMKGVADGEAQLVFGGEVIEHLWPDDIAAFLLEAHRVLASGGVLAMDSPNRPVCQSLQWTHPEHTLEFSVDEVVEILGLAGFDIEMLRGVWLCYDRERHGLLRFDDMDGQALDRATRIAAAPDNPEDSFVWWVHACRADRQPDADTLHRRLMELYGSYRAERLARLRPMAPVDFDRQYGRVVRHAGSAPGVLFHGPYAPVPEGSWEVVFRVRRDGPPAPADVKIARAEVLVLGEVVAKRNLKGAAFDPDTGWAEVAVPFEFETTRMAVQFRLVSQGVAPLTAQLAVELRRRTRRKPTGRATPVGRPEPTFGDVRRWVRRRAGRLARATAQRVRAAAERRRG
ncbi:methyltransferase domain-containing protein [Sporichthya polymorpha]|uniref:methyltransferase domain-containing protein n=1 Tax=Sporichthya polymorpha TaxID=35751 RepID=UPI000367A0FF|nr:methyltransferase domain-containing protein [Sporichthya polymorpha]